MKKLDRNLAKKPIFLNNICYTTHTWKNMTKSRKKSVWKELEKFQDKLCVYCESKAEQGTHTGHIEHFFDKSTHVHLTFDWSNLFGCCASKLHCGHYKDETLPGGVRRTYNTNLLIKPDTEDPEDYLQFLPSGKIESHNGLDTISEQKASETIKALHLDAPSLVRSREQQITRFQSKVTTALSFIDTGDEETIALAMIEYRNIEQEAKSAPHRTAIKQAVIWL
ncbi:retron Ec78 anti-phage system effector HNH endonuclease PtuB [Vibrio vulnificus]|uniref:retron Ec78 anti-phage system effector HNH endonuclease PtuB n=1 Tax=Vibrio vulnificus TaxID=672 RepID=UPI0006989307|nr:retron Ec78 anti-phage system effector HNH endonuclease PtuB [Vibrio vulnificus]